MHDGRNGFATDARSSASADTLGTDKAARVVAKEAKPHIRKTGAILEAWKFAVYLSIPIIAVAYYMEPENLEKLITRVSNFFDHNSF